MYLNVRHRRNNISFIQIGIRHSLRFVVLETSMKNIFFENKNIVPLCNPIREYAVHRCRSRLLIYSQMLYPLSSSAYAVSRPRRIALANASFFLSPLYADDIRFKAVSRPPKPSSTDEFDGIAPCSSDLGKCRQVCMCVCLCVNERRGNESGSNDAKVKVDTRRDAQVVHFVTLSFVVEERENEMWVEWRRRCVLQVLNSFDNFIGTNFS